MCSFIDARFWDFRVSLMTGSIGIADDVALPGRKQVNDRARSGPQRDGFGGGA